MRATLFLHLAICLAFLHPMTSAAQTQRDMNEAAGQDFRTADALLTRTFDRLMAKVSPAGKDALRKTERAWIIFRDQECAFETLGSTGGSVHPMVLAACAARLTRDRAKQLQAQLDCPEGDAACGGQ